MWAIPASLRADEATYAAALQVLAFINEHNIDWARTGHNGGAQLGAVLRGLCRPAASRRVYPHRVHRPRHARLGAKYGAIQDVLNRELQRDLADRQERGMPRSPMPRWTCRTCSTAEFLPPPGPSRQGGPSTLSDAARRKTLHDPLDQGRGERVVGDPALRLRRELPALERGELPRDVAPRRLRCRHDRPRTGLGRRAGTERDPHQPALPGVETRPRRADRPARPGDGHGRGTGHRHDPPCCSTIGGFGGADATYGPQPDPRAGVHNSRAVASPGRDLIRRPGEWGGFLDYTRDVVATFRSDPRILLWDVYNEPGNRMVFGPEGAHLHEPDFTAESLSLLRDSFAVAREIAPDHPLTTGAWSTPLAGATEAAYETEVDRHRAGSCPISWTFHAYLPSDRVAAIIDALGGAGGRCSAPEWMGAARGQARLARPAAALPRAAAWACLHWGLGAGGARRTWLPWPADLVAAHGGDADRSVWFHDLLTPEGTPYDPAEIALLQRLTQADARVG